MKGVYLRIGIFILLILSVVSIQVALDKSDTALEFYVRNIFLPLQRGRSDLLDRTSVSIGDFLYIILFLVLLLLIIRLIYYAITFKKNKLDFWVELLRFFTFPLVIYFSFLILWGGNYARRPLTLNWDTNNSKLNTQSLVELNEFLIDKLNEIVQDTTLAFPSLGVLNNQSDYYYHQRFGADLPNLKVKPTTLGYLLSYLGIHGYYNPFSGEAQYNKFILPFMHPFVITHEMAHQLGVAKEDDANLLSYVIGVQSKSPAYQYSAYFNLLLYAYSDLRANNKHIAADVLDLLNKHSLKDMDDLKKMYQKYKSSLRGFSNSIYDEYLRFHGQQKGLSSYNQVTKWVYYWEIIDKRNLTIAPLTIPSSEFKPTVSKP